MNLSRSRRWAVAVVAFFAAILLLTFLMGRGVRSVRLADGREVEIVAMTHGTNHTFVEGKFWGRLAQRFVSAPRAAKLGVWVYRQATEAPTLVIWTRWTLTGTTNRPARHASVGDAHGMETDPVPASLEATFSRPSQAILAWRFENYPRATASCVLRFYERAPPLPPVRVAELSIKPLHAATANRPTAPSAPLARTNGSFEFSLLSLRTGEIPPTSLTNRDNVIARPTMAWFEVRQHGVLNTNWTIRDIEVTGVTGNRFVQFPPRVEQTSGRLGVAFTDVFWPDEAGWNVTVEFARSRDFPTNRLWTLHGFPAALGNLPSTTNLYADAHGITLQTLEARRPNWTFTEPFRLGPYWRNANVSLAYTSSLPGVRIDLARAVDNRGQELRFGHGGDQGRGRYLAGLELKTNTTHLNLTFAIHQTERVEFFVKPQFDPAPSARTGK